MRAIGQDAGLSRELSPGVLRNTFEHDLLLEGRELSEVAYLMGQSKPDRDKVRALRSVSGRPRTQQRRTSIRTAVRTGGSEGAVEQLRMDF